MNQHLFVYQKIDFNIIYLLAHLIILIMSFDITHFLKSGDTKGNSALKGELMKKISDLMRDQKLFLLEYTYFRDSEKNGGSIVNANWMIEILNKLKDDELTNIITDMYGNIYTKSDGKSLTVNITAITDKLVDTKNFTNDQKDSIKNIFNFLTDNKQKGFIMKGYAGTGKTTTIVELSYYLLKEGLLTSIIFTAPTNKAVNVIKGKFRPYLKLLYEQITKLSLDDNFKFEDALDILMTHDVKIDFATIHKLLKYKTDFSNEGDRVFIRNGDSLITKYELIIIDECSMIPLNIVDSLFEEIRKGEFKSGDNYKKVPKILFCGDPAQLPPVGELTSSLFMNGENMMALEKYTQILSIDDNGFMTAHNHTEFKTRYETFTTELLSLKTTTLKTVVRSKIDNVTQVCYQIRRWVNNEVEIPNLQPYLNKKGVNFYKYDDGDKLKSDWFKTCLKQFKANKNLNIILTWTNKQSDIYNQTIRNNLFKKKDIKRFEKGDILMLNDFHNIDDSKKSKDITNIGGKFYTSEQIKIVDVSTTTKNVGEFSSRLCDSARKLKDAGYIEKKYVPIIETINKSTKRSYKCWTLTVQKLSDNVSEEELYIINVIDESEVKSLDNDKYFVTSQIKKLRKNLLGGLKNKSKQIDEHIIKPLWKEWYKIFMESFADVNYGYAISCHKAQGSNFYNVYVDAHDVFKNTNQDEMKRCFYTAATRTSNELHILF
jgi:hypothetical protein